LLIHHQFQFVDHGWPMVAAELEWRAPDHISSLRGEEMVEHKVDIDFLALAVNTCAFQAIAFAGILLCPLIPAGRPVWCKSAIGVYAAVTTAILAAKLFPAYRNDGHFPWLAVEFCAYQAIAFALVFLRPLVSAGRPVWRASTTRVYAAAFAGLLATNLYFMAQHSPNAESMAPGAYCFGWPLPLVTESDDPLYPDYFPLAHLCNAMVLIVAPLLLALLTERLTTAWRGRQPPGIDQLPCHAGSPEQRPAALGQQAPPRPSVLRLAIWVLVFTIIYSGLFAFERWVGFSAPQATVIVIGFPLGAVVAVLIRENSAPLSIWRGNLANASSIDCD